MEGERPAKRFKHQSYKQSLKEVHLPSALSKRHVEEDLADNSSHFREALDNWRELNLTHAFITFANKVEGLSASMPLLLLHHQDIIRLWLESVSVADDEGLKPLLDLLQKLSQDLGSVLSPLQMDVLQQLVKLLPRSLSAQTLTILLETFTAFFKYVVIPSDSVSEAWSNFQTVMPKCNPEVQRAVSELWGNILRRLKTATRENCALVIFQSAESDVGAWVFISCFKSVSQTLHTVTSSVFAPLVRYHLDCEESDVERTFTILRRVLTALAHHCKTAEQYSPVADFLVEFFTNTTEENTNSVERIRRLLELVTVVCSVRQGSRLTGKQLSSVVTRFQTLPLTDALHTSLLKFATSGLLAGEMALWMGPGRKVLERAWAERPLLALQLTGTLSDLHWGAWKLIALPHVTKHLPGMLDTHAHEALEVLCALAKEKRLDGMSEVWKGKVRKWVDRLFEGGDLVQNSDKLLRYSQILSISDLLPSLGPLLVNIINSALETADPRGDFKQRETNSTWVLGASLSRLALRKPDEWQESVDIPSWTAKIIEKWGWNGYVMDGLVSLVQAKPSSESALEGEHLYTSVQGSLLSHSRLLRLSVLRILSSSSISLPDGAAEISKRCLQGEEISIDVQGVRERILRISRINHSLRDGDELGADIAARWLIAQLKVNLRPLWKPAAEALAEIAGRFGDLVWKLLFDELQRASSWGTSPFESNEEDAPAWLDIEDEGDLDPISEEEKTWRDPSGHKIRSIVVLWLKDDNARRRVIQAQIVPERFDRKSYEVQLLQSLAEVSSLAQKHNSTLVPLFLSLAPPEAPTAMPRYKLVAWLELFSKFSNPKALRSTEDLHQLYITLLSHPDRQLQKLALSCIQTYKSPHLSRYQDSLQMLLDDTRWRDELTQLQIAEIERDERPQVVNVLIRILFGLMLEKKGRGRGAERRAAVLTALAGCTDEELGLLVDLMLKPINKDRQVHDEEGYVTKPLDEGVSDKQLVGFLNLLGDVVKQLGSRLLGQWRNLLTTLFDIIGYAQDKISQSKAEPDQDQEAPGEDVREDEEEGNNEGPQNASRTIRSIRQLGLKRFADFFRVPVSFDFTPYMPEVFRSFISPRLPVLDIENTQAPSSLLELFYIWSSKAETARFLIAYDDRTLPKVYDCLIATNVKPPVISKVFDIVENLLRISTDVGDVLNDVFKPHVPLLLTNLSIMVERSKGVASITDPLGRRQVAILSQIAPYLSDSVQASTLLSLFIPLLRKPSKVVPEKIKVDMLTIVQNLLPLIPELSDSDSPVHTKTYSLLAFLYQNLRSRPARISLSAAFQALSAKCPSLESLASLLEDFNAYSTKRIDEPDIDRRLSAFSQLNDTLYQSLTVKDWLPILYNMLYFIQDPEELAVRSNSSQAFKRFIDLAAERAGEYEETFMKVLYPGLKDGLRSKNELVRAEILGVISYAVSKLERISSLQEMRVLLAGGNEEANFFNNIHHIQVHRRTRALRRLAEYSEQGHFRNSTLAEVLVPLVANFIMAAGSVDHQIVTEAIAATGKMAGHLNWSAYHALVQQYLRLSRNKDASERVYVRTIVAILDNFHFPMAETVEVTEEKEDEQDQDEEQPQEATTVEEQPKVQVKHSRIADVVNSRLLPSLLKHLESRDETEDSLRIPVAVGIIKVAQHLPSATGEPQITKLVTVLSQVFRSKSQETRDLTRETLCRIAIMLGPSYLPMIIRELRGALTRGPHLHVLAFVVHALLVHVTSDEHAAVFHTLDDCVFDVAHVSAEVIFGESGKDVQHEDFKTKMREVRSSSAKGFDSFAILAKFITPPKISTLLVPIRNILHATETLKVMQQVEDLLRRIAGGLNANQHLKPADLISLCQTLITENSRFLKQAPTPKEKREKKDAAIVQLKRSRDADADHYANSSFRFVIFGLELFNTAIRRGRFDFQDAAVKARLESMVPVIGNTLFSTHMQVVVPGLKAAASIVKCPLKSIEKSLPVFIQQMIEIVKQAGSTESDAAQTALKSLATLLRDQNKAQVKEKDLIFLVEVLSPDLEEPARQASVFAILRAIVARKFVVPEIYDIMDKVAEIMVTNQSPQVQELCRGVLLQFLLEYPQGRGRLKNQMAFLAKNLSYVHESGRRSVMELLSAILSKFNPGLIKEYADLFFVALVMVVANDDSAKCREMAAVLIKTLYERLEDAQRRTVLSHVHTWAAQRGQPQLLRVSSQIYSIIIELLQAEIAPHASTILEDLNAILALSAGEGDDEDDQERVIEWQIPYHALVALQKLLTARPELVTGSEKVKVNWAFVTAHLLFPHTWVRTVASRLVNILFTANPVSAPKADKPEHDLFSLSGMMKLAKDFCLQLRSPNLDASLSILVVKNLFYVGKCFCLVEGSMTRKRRAGDDESEGDEDEEASDEEREEEDEEDGKEKHPLPWLFSKLSYQARSAYIMRRNKPKVKENWFHQPASTFRWFAAMVNHMEAEKAEQFLTHILNPVYRIAEDDTIRDAHMDELKTLAIELQDLLQNKVGTTKFANVYNRIRQGVQSLRQERRTARAVQAVVDPQAHAKRKQQRNVAKKESRKRKNQSFVEGKGKIKKRRAE
ncbi:hypothetical protein K474DRAFT_1670178 [Panus rudis PR-1116 ss-1]|nr:hypothetical protein K474DRAFT_1670178 [Panus rudis PR-1116 ss-1]